MLSAFSAVHSVKLYKLLFATGQAGVRVAGPMGVSVGVGVRVIVGVLVIVGEKVGRGVVVIVGLGVTVASIGSTHTVVGPTGGIAPGYTNDPGPAEAPGDGPTIGPGLAVAL